METQVSTRRGSSPLSVSFRRTPPNPHRVSLGFPVPHRSSFVAMAAKKSPKRLKYASLRFPREDGLLYVEADPSGGESWKLDPIVQFLKEGAVGVIPTDTVYVIVCDVKSHSAIERLRRIKNIRALKPLSILCYSFHDIDTYTMGFPRGDSQGHTNIFRAVRHCLPGPYTFILTASKVLPKQCGSSDGKYPSRKNIGVRMPNDAICRSILQKMGGPLICTSVELLKENERILELDTSVIKVGLDFIVDGGVGTTDPSTVVDMTRRLPTVLRKGKGPIQPWMVAERETDLSTIDDENAIPYYA